MRTIASTLLLSTSLLLAACAPKVNDPADIRAVKQTMEAFSKAINAADAAGAVAMLTDRTVWVEPHMPAATGKDAVAKFLADAFSQVAINLTTTVDDVSVAAGLAVMRGTFKEHQTPKREDLAPVNASGNFMVTLQRQADGTWKWDRFIVASDQPMPGTTADGAEEQAVMQAERALTRAVVKPDIPALETYLAKEWMPTNDGQVTSRAQVLTDLKSGAYKVESDEIRDLSVHVFGDVAVATMLLDAKGTYQGARFTSVIRSTDFFVKRDGRWQVVNSQNTTVK